MSMEHWKQLVNSGWGKGHNIRFNNHFLVLTVNTDVKDEINLKLNSTRMGIENIVIVDG